VAGGHRAERIVRRVITAAVLAAAALVVEAADLALTHIDEVDAVAATEGFRTVYFTPERSPL
jgi:hypothetical protein